MNKWIAALSVVGSVASIWALFRDVEISVGFFAVDPFLLFLLFLFVTLVAFFYLVTAVVSRLWRNRPAARFFRMRIRLNSVRESVDSRYVNDRDCWVTVGSVREALVKLNIPCPELGDYVDRDLWSKFLAVMVVYARNHDLQTARSIKFEKEGTTRDYI